MSNLRQQLKMQMKVNGGSALHKSLTCCQLSVQRDIDIRPISGFWKRGVDDGGGCRHTGLEAWFPVCTSCVSNVQLKARSCFLCMMGARPKAPTQRQHTISSDV